MLALYLFTLGASAGLTGLFVHQVLAGQGFVPVFQAGLFLALGFAFLYVTFQVGYMLLVRIYKPTKDSPPLFFECLSHVSTLVLVPYILKVPIPWPADALERAEPLIFLATFLSLHGFFKLLSFFAAIRGEPASRKGALGWLAATAVFALAAYLGLGHWADLLEANRPVTAEEPVRKNVAGVYVSARPVQEGSQFRIDLTQQPGRGFALLLAPQPGDGGEPVTRVHVAAQFEGASGHVFTDEFRLAKEGWTALRLRPEDIPQGATACRIAWNAGEEPKWQRFSALLPVMTSSRKMLVGGPAFWQPRDDASPPNLVVVVVDGLSGHKGPGTVNAEGLTSLAAQAQASVVFENAYTPTPDDEGAIVSLLTGLSPLRHGYRSGRDGALPAAFPTLAERLHDQGYITAAFVETGGIPEAGFDFFSTADDSRADEAAVSVEAEAPAAPATVAAASERALAWLKENADAKCMAVVYMSDLDALRGKELDGPRIRELDRKLGALLRPLRADGKTAILVTSPYGLPAYKENASTPAERLSEGGLHVPCMLSVPGVEAVRRPEVVSLEDLPAAVVTALGGAFPASVGSGEAVSVSDAPLALSIRSGKWRFTWQTEETAGGVGTSVLYDVERMRRGSTANLSLRNKQLAQDLFGKLQSYRKAYAPN